MLNKIIAFSINNKLIIGIMTLALIIWGVWSAVKIPIDAVPDITNNQVQIITQCPTLAGQEVEQLVTYPIEQSIANLPHLEELRSISRFGLSVITVVFKEHTDIYFARQLINEKLNAITDKMPEGVNKPELGPVSTGLGEVYQYIIHPKQGSEKKYSTMDLRTMQDWIVSRQLYGTPGIAEVASFGGQLKQYEVSVNPNKLLAMGVSIPEIFLALETNNENTGGAYIDKKPNAYFIRGVGLIGSVDDIRNIVVKNSPNGLPILIKDVAEVGFGTAVRYGALTYNGEKDAVGGIVMMLKGENSAEVVNAVKEKMKIIQKSLPEDVLIEPFLDRTDLVNRAIGTVEKNLIEGALIVIFVLVLFLGNFRAGLIVASAIPLSMLFALGMMNIFGVSANLMSLGAIDFGLIVDGSVIIVEAIFHRISKNMQGISNQQLTQKQMDKEVYSATIQIRKSAAFGELIILIVYIPILSLIGIEGKMFRPMAQTVSFAIIGALIISLTYIPMASALFLSKKTEYKQNFSDKMVAFFQKIYTPMLAKALKTKKTILAITLAVFISSIFLFSKMGGEFIPNLVEGDFAFHCILPQGTSISQSIETSMQVSRAIKKFDEVKMVVGKTGSAEIPTDPMPPEATDIIIILKPEKEWKTKKSYDQLADEILEKLSVFPGVFFEKNQPIQMRFSEMMTGIRQDVAVKIFGENMDTLLNYAKKVGAVVQNTEGTTEPSIERVDGLPQISVKYNRAQIANYGLNIKDVNHILSTAFAGGKAGVVFENERQFDLVVRLDSLHRSSEENIGQLLVPINKNLQIPLSQIAEIKTELGPAQISRENGKRRIVIGFNVKNKDVESVVSDLQEKLDKTIKLPEGYYFTFGGTFENLQAATSRLLIAVPIALALIFVLLYFTFSSIKLAVLVYTAIPLSAIGGIFALILRDMPFSISAGIGFIALFGVSVLNGIVLISTFNQLEKDGETDPFARIMKGASQRLRPILMTAMVASLGFLPMALSNSAGAEVQKPLATVVIGGLISSTFLTLFVLPMLYIIFKTPKKTIVFSKKTIILPLFLLLLNITNAQTTQTLSLEKMMELASQNNLHLQSQDFSIESAEYLKKSVFQLPKTNFNLQYGQYNSINHDLGFQINQPIPFPSIYKANVGLFKAEKEAINLKRKGSLNEMNTQIKIHYWNLQFYENTKTELLFLDSLYSEFIKIAELKFNAGETNILEKTTAQIKQVELKSMLNENNANIESTYNSLKRLMNMDANFKVIQQNSYEPLLLINIFDTALLANNPVIQFAYQQAKIAEQNKKTERAQSLPEFSLGYFNQSLIGFQNINGNEIYFDKNKRFQGVNIGISLPITYFSNVSKIKSMELQKQSILKEAENTKLYMQTELQNYFIQYNYALEKYNYYKNQALPSANIIIKTATLAFANGEIAYLEYTQALQNASTIKMDYLQSINQINQIVSKIEYFINK